MEFSNHTILITGGTSGIGLELAKQLLALGNTVIVTGRDSKKLEETKQKLPAVHTIQSDVSDPVAIAALFKQVTEAFPKLNVLVNNAGVMKKINLNNNNYNLVDLTKEIEINLMGPIRMIQQFLPYLKTKSSASIINVSSGLAFVPLPISPIYCATKAGLHSYTESLRIQLKNTSVKVIELAPPGTETPLFSDEFTKEDVGAAKPMPVDVMVKHTIKGLTNGTREIRPGLSNVLKMMNRIAPGFILKQLGKSADSMVAKN